MFENICQYCKKGCKSFAIECPGYEPRTPNNVCPYCGFLHRETFPLECKNCHGELAHNEQALSEAATKGYIKWP